MQQYTTRALESHLYASLETQKICVLYGARQTGKTTLAKHIAEHSGKAWSYYNCDEDTVRKGLSYENAPSLRGFLGKRPLIVIDEAQRIPNIGLKLKILHDSDPTVAIIATGSSSFSLANSINEPLTGRMHASTITPLSYNELRSPHTLLLDPAYLRDLLLYGSYPEVTQLATYQEKKTYLLELTRSYLTKDIFELQEIQKSDQLLKLLQLLAYQIGSEVNYQELANRLDLHIETIKRYIWLLEESFILYRLPGFQRNHRNEIGKSRKIYFWDLGVRNALINDFNDLDARTDRGAIRENRLITERKKLFANASFIRDMYFWRTYQQHEMDYIETRDAIIHAYEFKRSEKKQKTSTVFEKAYPHALQTGINTSNYYRFLSEI